MKESPKYAKSLHGESLRYTPLPAGVPAGVPFELVVTLGEMELEDAFHVVVPPDWASGAIGELLERVFPQSTRRQSHVRGLLDVMRNPDLPEMYRALLEVFQESRGFRCDLRFYVNHGPEIEPAASLRTYLATRDGGPSDTPVSAVLDLVIEQAYTPLRYAVCNGYAESPQAVLEWLRRCTLLYFINSGRIDVAVDPATGAGAELSHVARELAETGDLRASCESGLFITTPRAKQALEEMLAESETLADRYDVFGDVRWDPESGTAEFGAGRGLDLRVQVYEAEGMDPLRVVFLHLMRDGTLDRAMRRWRDAPGHEDFFDRLLAPVADRDGVPSEALERVIEDGLTYDDERRELAAAQARRRAITRRADVQASGDAPVAS